MAGDSNDPNAEGRRRRAPTIDLKATEIPNAPPEQPAESQPDTVQAAVVDEPVAIPPEAAAAASGSDSLPPPRDPPDPRRTSDRPPAPWLLIAGGAVAGLLLFAAGLLAGQALLGGAPRQVTVAPDPALSADFANRIARVEGAMSAPRTADPQLLARIAAAEAAVKTAAELAAAREKRSDEIANVARDARSRADAAVSAADTAQKTRDNGSDLTRSDLDAVSVRIAALEQAVKTGQAELTRKTANADDQKSRMAVAATALRHAVERSDPFAAELAAMKSLAADQAQLAPLETFAATGVPSAQTLGRDLSQIMPALWKLTSVEARDAGFLERLQSNAEKLVRIRPIGEVTGDDPAAILARIELRAAHSDIRGALEELAKLPAQVRAPAEDWIRKAQTRNAAVTAARDLVQAALGGLAKSGS